MVKPLKFSVLNAIHDAEPRTENQICTPTLGAARNPDYVHGMLTDILNRLFQPDPEPLPDADARLALTALLVRVARSDHNYDADEKARILDIARQRYGLDNTGANELLAEAETFESEAPDTVRFTRAIKDAVPYEARLAVIEALWQVVLADGKRTKEEDALLRLVSNLLGVSDVDSAKARQRVAE